MFLEGYGMNRRQTLSLLIEHKQELVLRFGVARLALFGSVARDAAKTGSDVDVLVDFDSPATSARYFLGRAVLSGGFVGLCGRFSYRKSLAS
jgi:predicted nucleotidyltransferase